MSNYDNTNRGALFDNTRRTKETQPQKRGTLNVGGVEHWISGWIKKDSNGNEYISLSVEPKETTQTAAQAAQHAAPPQRQQQAAPVVLDDDSDIPF